MLLSIYSEHLLAVAYLVEIDLYVVEGQSLYLDNNTTNATQVGSGATYTVDWGDGSADDFISSNTVGGGASTSADRLEHTWADGTLSGSGRDTG